MKADGSEGLDELPHDQYLAFWADIPLDWNEATLIIATSSDSSAGSERYDFRAVEFVHRGVPPSDEPPETAYQRGDANSDGSLDIADAIHTLAYLFGNGVTLSCMKTGDANDDGAVDISDAIALLSHLFGGTAPLPEPFPVCGTDPTPDELTCEAYPACQ